MYEQTDRQTDRENSHTLYLYGVHSGSPNKTLFTLLQGKSHIQ